MPAIRILPPEVVNRIAAGEVVERPGSVIKELIENSIDAHATEVLIDLDEGGKKRVTIRDNGSGMEPEDLPLAFQSHATSKLREAELSQNLFGVATLGFRGEALASVAAVAEVEVISRVPRAEHAFRWRPGRSVGEPEPAAGPPGTLVEVRGLFYNVPARRKFLRTVSTELSHVIEQVTRIALGFPGVGFRLNHNGKKLLALTPCDSLRERLTEILGREKAEHLVEVREDAGGGVRLHGFVGSPELRRSDSRGQHFYVNGRWVRDRLLAHALRSAFQGFLIPGRQPVCYLFLELPLESVDVNVHPTKTEVRFRDPGQVYPLVHSAVRESLGPGRHASPSGTSSGGGSTAFARDLSPPDSSGRSDTDEQRRKVARAALDFLSSPAGREHPFPPSAGSFESGRAVKEKRSISLDSAAAAAEAPGSPQRISLKRRAFQVLDSYIVLEEEDGIALIDQHALHEKILFEEIERRLHRGEVVRQKLLVPEIFSLPLEQMPLVERASELLGRCGFEIEPFGDREVAVHAVPKLLERGTGAQSYRETVLEVLRWLRDEGHESLVAADADQALPEALANAYRELASLLACKRAVKAGSPLSPEEIDSLIEHANLASDPRHCPHGRPTAVYLSRRELERRFDRK